MPTNLGTPYYDEGDEVTCFASAAVTGKRFVKISGARQPGNPNDGVSDAITGGNITVALCEAGDSPFGVAAYDAPAGTLVTVYRAPKIVPVTTGGAVTAGAEVAAGADGVAVSGSGGGLSIDTAASGSDAQIALFAAGAGAAAE